MSGESAKERTDRQLVELLNELRVVLPGAQILLGFLFTIPFATGFGRVTDGQRAMFLAALSSTLTGTVLLMAPAVYHRMRWQRGGKGDVVLVGHRFFVAGTGCLGIGVAASLLLVVDVLFTRTVAVGLTAATAILLAVAWYLLPLGRGRQHELAREE